MALLCSVDSACPPKKKKYWAHFFYRLLQWLKTMSTVTFLRNFILSVHVDDVPFLPPKKKYTKQPFQGLISVWNASLKNKKNYKERETSTFYMHIFLSFFNGKTTKLYIILCVFDGRFVTPKQKKERCGIMVSASK